MYLALQIQNQYGQALSINFSQNKSQNATLVFDLGQRATPSGSIDWKNKISIMLSIDELIGLFLRLTGETSRFQCQYHGEQGDKWLDFKEMNGEICFGIKNAVFQFRLDSNQLRQLKLMVSNQLKGNFNHLSLSEMMTLLKDDSNSLCKS